MLSPEMSYLTSLFKPWVMSLSLPAEYRIKSVFRAPCLITADAAGYAVHYEGLQLHARYSMLQGTGELSPATQH